MKIMSENSALERMQGISDFPTLQRFASVLWKQDNSYHGASIMVGAGFSRCSSATADESKKLPLWFDFSNTLQKELGTQGNSDPLRIAEEYTAYFGRQALNELIKKEINDASWEPGELHNSLLRLPWTEVLTTNWDTLLERASENIHETFYSVVHQQEDLSHACSPRIVKLHGTLNVTNNLTFTQEDYRTFPIKHAAFVNFARQVFIENELCLLGFSGDDPNFLQWAGWVRDHLSTGARRIYLVGALGLNAAKRKYLESINIAPIDLAMLVAEYDDPDLKHKKATEIFINALHELKPKPSWDWRPVSTRDASFEVRLEALKQDRESYPGWIICPSRLRFFVHSSVDSQLISKQVIDSLTIDQRATLLYEIAWRYNVSFCVAPEWLVNEMLNISTNLNSNVLSKKQQLEVTAYVLKISRWYEEDNGFKNRAKSFMEENVKFWSESEDLLIIHEATTAKLNLNYSELEQLLPKIKAVSPDLKIKKASLYGELGLFDEGKRLLLDARRYLIDKYKRDKYSVYLLSRLSLVEGLLGAMDRHSINANIISETSRIRKCDFWQHIESTRSCVQNKIETEQSHTGIELLFEPGTYKDNSATINFSNEVHPLVVFEEMTSEIGIPVRWDHVNLMVDVAGKLLQLKDMDFHHRLYLTILIAKSETDSILEKSFSRIQLAKIPGDDCEKLIEWCIEAISFWVDKLSNNSGVCGSTALTKTRVLVEILARLSVRASPSKSKQIFRLAMSWGHKNVFRHIWLWKSFEHLIKYSLNSVPSSAQGELLLEALKFPLAPEIESSDPVSSFEWPNPVIRGELERKDSSEIDHRIDQIIDLVVSNSDMSRFAIERLLPLLECNYLHESEKKKLCTQVWGHDVTIINLPKTGLLNWVTLKLPSYDLNALMYKFKQYVFDTKAKNFFDVARLLDITNCRNISISPSQDEALKCFDILTGWSCQVEESHELDFFNDNEDNLVGKCVSEALSRCIVPALGKTDLNEFNYIKVKEFIKRTRQSYALLSLPYFAQNVQNIEVDLEIILRDSLHSPDNSRVSNAAFSICEWRKLCKCESNENLIATLVTMVTLNRESSAASIIWSVNELLVNEFLLEHQVRLLSEVVPTVFDNSNYNTEVHIKKELANVSLLRSEVVKLAKTLNDLARSKELERVLDEANADPLPEVRFSAIS
ncbi:SIR2-like protein [Vibrio crassostreae]|nr:SIR2-like protein [Vibrio crassostreae]CAK1719228.1 SIR2-like protein [Vibrio crassostreae]CAK2222992.1 SIR2-like protein [Vibrio crassostreae]CAK2320802.1 SIR2-like protein [Vibrio crassostreae]CAK3427635.1 SIR2-like protein [Vibrio crassostreae]